MPTPALGRAARTSLGLSLLLLGSTLPRAATAQDVMTAISDKHMESVLDEMGIDYTKSKEHTWKLKLDSRTVLLFLEHDNTDSQLYIGFGDKTVSPSKMNEWNKSKRFGRAYADDDSNPVLESDLDFAGGVTDDTLKAWIKLFKTLIESYVKFLNN